MMETSDVFPTHSNYNRGGQGDGKGELQPDGKRGACVEQNFLSIIFQIFDFM